MIAQLILAGVIATSVFSMPLQDEFEQFKKDFNKNYLSTAEYDVRFHIFKANKKMIDEHNEKYAKGEETYEMGINHFADMKPEEYRKYYEGLLKVPDDAPDTGATFLEPSFTALPASVDWRTKGYVTPVKNQGDCGSCWAFSATGSLEGQHFKKTGKLVSLSEQNLVDCSGPEGDMGCDGGWMDWAFNYIQKNKGIDTEASYPYKARDMHCAFNRTDVGATDVGHVDIAAKNETALQVAVATAGPVSVAIDASHSGFHFYKKGVYNPSDCSQTSLDHGVLAVGYGTDPTGGDYWLVKNSWGGNWGNKGYIWMARNRGNKCGIVTKASYPSV